MDFFMTVAAKRMDRDSALRCRPDDPGSPPRPVAFAVGPGARSRPDGDRAKSRRGIGSRLWRRRGSNPGSCSGPLAGIPCPGTASRFNRLAVDRG